MKEWEVIIVGAGPAGSALACRLRPRYRVLLLENPHAVAGAALRIGESLPGATRVLLQRLGIYDGFLAQGHVERGASISVWDTDAPTWFDHVRDPHGAGWHLDRVRFNASLRDAAVAAGAVLVDTGRGLRAAHDGERWCIDLEHLGQGCAAPTLRTHRATVLVDASGRSMAVARQLGLERRDADKLICLYAHLPVDIHDKDQATRVCADTNGWWYSVRVPSGQRVLAFHLDRDDLELKALLNPAQLLAKSRRHMLFANIRTATMDFQVHAQPAGGGRLDPDVLAGLPAGFFAVGDAMVAFDPIASQGLFNALATAEGAARAIERYSDGFKDARDRYLDETRVVHARYRERLGETYAAVTRYSIEPFWQRRISKAAKFQST